MINQKKGVSPIIGYVLLVAGIIAVSALIYPWMKSYVPQEAVACQDGSSVFLKSVSCLRDTTTNELELRTTLRNNGLFNLDGFMIYGTNISDELATIDLAQYSGGTEGLILFKDGRNPLEPNEDINYIFNIGTAVNDLKKIEIIPTRFETINNKKRFAICGNSKVEELITCVDKTIPVLTLVDEDGIVNAGDSLTISWDTGDNSYGQVYFYRVGNESEYIWGAGSSGTETKTINIWGNYVFKLFAGDKKEYVLATKSVEIKQV